MDQVVPITDHLSNNKLTDADVGTHLCQLLSFADLVCNFSRVEGEVDSCIDTLANVNNMINAVNEIQDLIRAAPM